MTNRFFSQNGTFISRALEGTNSGFPAIGAEEVLRIQPTSDRKQQGISCGPKPQFSGAGEIWVTYASCLQRVLRISRTWLTTGHSAEQGCPADARWWSRVPGRRTPARLADWLLPLTLLSLGLVAWAPTRCQAADPTAGEGVSSRETRKLAARGVPFQRLSAPVGKQIRDVVNNPSFFRRMPSQQIECDSEMFTFLVRRPEVMVNIWDLMGITKVSAKRTSPYSFMADDGVGTQCQCDLVYGDGKLHIYYGRGNYHGSMAPRKVSGRCVCILTTQDRTDESGDSVVVGTMDVFLKLDNLGADLLTRTIGPFVGKTADYNFVETAKFISQISEICRKNPAAAQGLASKLNRVSEPVRREFAAIAARIATSQVDPSEWHRYSRHPSAPPESVPGLTERVSARGQNEDLRVHVGTSQPENFLGMKSSAEMPSAPVLSGVGTVANIRKTSVPLPPPSAVMPSKPHIYMRR